MTIGQYIKSKREDTGLSLRKVQKLTGIQRGYISQIEHDKIIEPGYTTLKILCELYKTDFKKLLDLFPFLEKQVIKKENNWLAIEEEDD